MSLDRALSEIRGVQRAVAEDREAIERLHKGGPGDTSGGMESRVTRLEEWSKLAAERFESIDDKLATLPTKADLLTMVVATVTTGLAIVGVIVAALSYFGDRAEKGTGPAAQPAPIIIQVPTPAAASASPKR